MQTQDLTDLSKDELIDLITVYAKNWLALDGLWFQSVEAAGGMDAAMAHNMAVWERYTVIEARRIKEFLGLPEHAGPEGLARALRFRLYAPLNEDKIVIDGDTLTYYVQSCRVQNARKRKGMPFHPCKRVGIIEYGGFAQTIDPRFVTECVSCYPDLTDATCACIWRFTLV